jgi:hypothetical protein
VDWSRAGYLQGHSREARGVGATGEDLKDVESTGLGNGGSVEVLGLSGFWDPSSW